MNYSPHMNSTDFNWITAYLCWFNCREIQYLQSYGSSRGTAFLGLLDAENWDKEAVLAPLYYCWSRNKFSFTCTLCFTVSGKSPGMGTAKQCIFEFPNFNALVGIQGWLPHLISIKVGLDVAARALKHDWSAISKIQPYSEGSPLEITLPSQNINPSEWSNTALHERNRQDQCPILLDAVTPHRQKCLGLQCIYGLS